MATAFAPPKGYDFKYDFKNFDPKAFQKAEEKYLEKIKKFCLKHTDSTSPLVGELIRFPVADGYAVYMVYRTKPLQIIHVPIGDAWHADTCIIRGLRLQDVRERIEHEKALDKLFGEAKATS